MNIASSSDCQTYLVLCIVGLNKIFMPSDGVNWHLTFADIDGLRFTSSSIEKAKGDYKKLYYGLKNLAAPKREAIEKFILDAWEGLKKERGIKHSSDPQKKKTKI